MRSRPSVPSLRLFLDVYFSQFVYFFIWESRDFYRFEIEQDDRNEAVMFYSFFKGNKINFPRINSDKRCKIPPIEIFQSENHWCV